ncbi:hypothetical protein [Salidesulfovibrio brasiliensis]|uniref:hypothetical protein n=1 Tax=Salidesulfovibrio brasiliensis TaxID=221711 RepID=UPI0006CFFC9B|nr:hypothetical protein [Salidesulfovibrio brasiliensis]
MRRKLSFTFQVWLCVWLLVTFLSYAISWTGITIPLPGKTLIISTLMVPVMLFIIIPCLKRREP